MGPDEACYSKQAKTVRERGLGGFRVLAERFLSDPEQAALPSPVRWLWIGLCAATSARTSTVVSAALMPLACWWLFSFWLPGWAPVLVACGSPLFWTLSRRALQDVTVAILTVLTLGAASAGAPWLLAVSVLALLGAKEAGVLMLPAAAGLWLLADHPLLPGALAIAASLALWLAVTRLLLGRNAWRVLRAAKDGHATEYTKAYQSGMGHRLLVDLTLVSPLLMLFACAGATASIDLAFAPLAIFSTHTLAPVRNVRTILAADLLIRGLVGAYWAASPLVLLTLLTFDACLFWRMRNVYDPTTHTLTAAFGMQPSR